MIRPHLLYGGSLSKSIRNVGPTFTDVPVALSLIRDLSEEEQEDKQENDSDFVMSVNPSLGYIDNYSLKAVSDGKRFLLGAFFQSDFALMKNDVEKLDELVPNYFQNFKDNGWNISHVAKQLDMSHVLEQLSKKESDVGKNGLVKRIKELYSVFKEDRYKVELSINVNDNHDLDFVSDIDSKKPINKILSDMGLDVFKDKRYTVWDIASDDLIREKFMELAQITAKAAEFYWKISANKSINDDLFIHIDYKHPIKLKKPFREDIVGNQNYINFDIKGDDNVDGILYDSMDAFKKNAQGIVVPITSKPVPVKMVSAPKMDSKSHKENNGTPLNEILKLNKNKIYEGLSAYVVGQDSAKDALASAAYKHYARIHQKQSDVTIEKSNLLLYGPSGSGKTYIVESLAKILDVPFITTDATNLTAPGYVGEDASQMIEALVTEVGGDRAKAQAGIIFIDEIDKLSNVGNRTSVNTTQVQSNLLKLIEGSVIKTKYGPVDTRNILFVCGGAFAGDQNSGVSSLENRVKTRLGLNDRKKVGFETGTQNEELNINYDALLSYVKTEDLQAYGLIPELIGRLHNKVGLNKLTKGELLDIITKPINAPLKQTEKLFAQEGIEIKFEKGALEYLAEKAYSSNTGAREIKSYLTVIEDAYMSLIGSNQKQIIVTKDDVAKYLK